MYTKIFCHECNIDVTKANFHQHNKTQKHLRNKENFKAGEEKPIRNESDLLNLFSQIKNALDTLEKNESKVKWFFITIINITFNIYYMNL